MLEVPYHTAFGTNAQANSCTIRGGKETLNYACL